MTIKEKAKVVMGLGITPQQFGLATLPLLSEKVCTLICPFCGTSFSISVKYFYERVYSKKFLKHIVPCSSRLCRQRLKQETIKEQTRLGQTSAKGHKPSKDQIQRWKMTLQKNGTIQKIHEVYEFRRGKTLEEIYGVDKGAEVRERIKTNTPNIQPDYRGKRAHQGFSFSDESKKQISDSLKCFYQSELGQETRKIISEKLRKSWFAKTDEERLKTIKLQHEGQLRAFAKNFHAGWGYLKAWYEDSPTQPYRSSWEKAYFEYLNTQKVPYKSNKTLYIKYLHPDGTNHFYVPDVLIFDSGFRRLVEIQEIKPSHLLNHPVNKAKCLAANDFCQKQGIPFIILTELELKNRGIKL